MFRITRAIDFCCSLRYRLPDLSEAENRELFGPRAAQHGHNYRLEVTLRGEVDPVTGMLLDLKHLQEILDREIMARFDHRDLNADTPYFEKQAPTLENVAAVIHQLLLAAVPKGMLDRSRLRQDDRLWVDVIEPRDGSTS